MYELKNKEIILASASSSRKAILKNANIRFTSQPAYIDEEAIKQSAISEGVSLADCAILLAEIKGRRIALANPNAFIIASDQLLDYGGRCFSKPGSLDKAKTQLAELQGKTHSLHTSVVVFLNGERIWHHLSSPIVTLRSLSDFEIDKYLDEIGDSAMQTPASYQIEDQGCHIIAQFNGGYYDILGLPLLPLLGFMRLHGLSLANKKIIQ